MPQIKLIKEYKTRGKVFPEGTNYSCSWKGYRELLEKGYCEQHPEDTQTTIKTNKKKTKIDKPVKPE